MSDEERKKIQEDDRRQVTKEAVEKARINRARSSNPAFQRLRSAGWDVVKDLQASHHEDQATGRAEVRNRASRAAGLTRSASMSKAHSKAAAIVHSHLLQKREPKRTTTVSFKEPLYDAYSLHKAGCSDLDWRRLDSYDAIQLYNNHTRFSDAVHGTYNMQGKVSLDSNFARAGFKSPRVRGGMCLLEMKIVCENLRASKVGYTHGPDSQVQVKIFNLITKRWRVEWQSDVQIRNESPIFRKLLRIEIPDGAHTHAIIVVMDKSRRAGEHAEIGRALVNLDIVVEASEQPGMAMPAYACVLEPALAQGVSDEEYVQAMYASEEAEAALENGASGRGGSGAGAGEEASSQLSVGAGKSGREGVGRLILRTDRLADASMLSVPLRIGNLSLPLMCRYQYTRAITCPFIPALAS